MPLALYNLSSQQGINIHHIDFPDCELEALYIYEWCTATIFLSNTLLTQRAKLRSVLAEEMGHHFTSVGHALSYQHTSYTKRLEISRTEYRAMKWAAHYLISIKSLLHSVTLGFKEIWEFADHFEVTHEMMQFRFQQSDAQEQLSSIGKL